MSDVLVRLEDVSKKFCRQFKRSLWYGVEDTLSDLRLRPKSDTLRPEEFWAADEVSFEVKRGECLALMGRNGAGKTTLLKIINGLIKLDKGRVELHGRVGALIALGAGFNPILTGRENVYINGSILGLAKSEIDGKFDEIVEFAEISEFIDTPVQSYSSGMLVRLGFAVAAHINPDVLLVDEVLAVGDSGFKVKCYNKIHEIREATAIILVSHSIPAIAKVCTDGIVMNSGRVVTDKKNVAQAVQSYLSKFDAPKPSIEGNGSLEIKHVELKQGSSSSLRLYPNSGRGRFEGIDPTAPTVLELECKKRCQIEQVAVLWSITDSDQKLVAQAMSGPLGVDLATQSLRIRSRINDLALNQGNYTISVHVFESHNKGCRTTVLGGIRDFASFSIARKMFVGVAPVLYPNSSEVQRGGAPLNAALHNIEEIT